MHRPTLRSRPLAAASMTAALAGAVLLGTTLGPATGDAAQTAAAPAKARNVIMFLGDGMGDSEITVARNYAKGAAGQLAMDAFDNTGEYTTYAVSEDAPGKPEYVTDSAASGTGWATGQKTSNGRISTAPRSTRSLRTILEIAQRAGYATGDVSTAELTDATPAVLASHVNARGCQGPADMAACPTFAKQNGGPGSIAEQEVDHGIDVILGGGKQRFDQLVTGGAYAGQPVTASALGQGYTIATDRAGLDAISPSQKVLGLFSAGNMDLEWTGPLASPYPGPAPQSCVTSNPARPATEPHLNEMTDKALSLLTKKSNGNKQGFFLQVEGASIDKQDHAENPCGQIGETIEFDNAVAAGLTYQKSHPDTLVVVTADHGHTSQIIDPQTPTDHSPGAIATLITHDGAPMVVNYATNLDGRSQSHTGTEVRIAAVGPASERVRGITDQTDLFTTFRAALGI